MKKRFSFILVALLFAGGGAYYFSIAHANQKRGQRQIHPVQVRLGTIEDTVQATGEVMPFNRVEIKPPIAGRIEELLVNEGSKVRAHQILGWMSSTDRAAILDAARAKGPDELEHWQDAYKPTPIVAPLDGTVILRNVVVGQTVDGTTVLYAMSDRLIVKADVDETDIGRIKMGMPAAITLDSYPNEPIPGEVFQILYEGVNVSNVITYGVKIRPSKLPAFFRSQMTANIKLTALKKENVLLLPPAAIITTPMGEKQVMLPGEKNKPVAQIIETGLESDESVEITSGLTEGQTVLVISKRYVPPQAASNSPLVMNGPKSPGGGGGRRSSGAH